MFKTSSSALVILFLGATMSLLAQQIPTHKVISNKKLFSYLKPAIKKELSNKKGSKEAILGSYFRDRFKERFFYDWTTFDERFSTYNTLYGYSGGHESRAKDHMGKYNGNTQWKLPFNYLNGEEVNAYALRHLARQHKMVDVAFQYHYTKDPLYIDYFTEQMQSLNVALEAGDYEKIADGNGVYEAFRSGYRVLNWLEIHAMFLGEAAYSDEEQLTTIATLLQHGAHLYNKNDRYTAGNHQTRGVSALAMIAILLRDFEGTDLWLSRALDRLGEHLDKEINADGFQFERSVHYHMSDIANYFFVYQLAKINNTKIGASWERKLRSLFTTLSKIAYPDKAAPVLQDDTEIPWAEKNDISGAMTLGYLLFEDPKIGYFAGDKVSRDKYWFLQQRQLDLLTSIPSKKPDYESLEFTDTGYYITREGWDKNDKMMIISAGLDKDKPDHQHGDMLGIQAVANGQVILPNYQVRYPYTDFYFFKNSMVKNVALVDGELQGKQWISNQGGSGFGKFKELPQPKTLAWTKNDSFDFFAGSHDGFENIGVTYSRQVIYLKDDFWVIKDNFSSDKPHTYKQIWQGHYTLENGPDLIRSNFPDATGTDIFQLNAPDSVNTDGRRGKEWAIVSKSGQKDFNFITVVFPYNGSDNRLDEDAENLILLGWAINKLPFSATGTDLRSLSKENKSYLFQVKEITLDSLTISLNATADLFIERTKDSIAIHSLSDKNIEVAINGDSKNIKNGKEMDSNFVLEPGEKVLCNFPN